MPAVIDLVKKIYEVIRKYLDEATYDAFVGELSKLLEATPPEQDVEMVCMVEKAPEWEIGFIRLMRILSYVVPIS